MRLKKSKYALLPNAPLSASRFGESPLVLQFRKADGRFQKIDLQFLVQGQYPRPQIGNVCAEVFWLDMQHCANATRSSAQHALRAFNRFLDWRAKGGTEHQVNSTLQFSVALFLEYQVFLASVCPIEEITADYKYHSLAAILRRLVARHPDYLPAGFRIPSSRFMGYKRQLSAKEVIPLDTLKKITAAASKEVRQIRENHRRALALLGPKLSSRGQDVVCSNKKEQWQSLPTVMPYLIRERELTNRISKKTRAELKRQGHPKAEELISWYAPAGEAQFIPFLVLLYLRTAINVTSIQTLKRDCLKPHPLPLRLTLLRFSKPRAGSHSDQELSFPSHQAHGVVDLIQFLLKYTEPWVGSATREEKTSLFLYPSRSGAIRSADRLFGQAGLAHFIERHDLPHFSFDQMRPTVATLLYLQTKDIFRVQRLLGHSSLKTTIRYIKGAGVEAHHNQQMNAGIDRMIESITGIQHRQAGCSVFNPPFAEVVAEKVRTRQLASDAAQRMLLGACNTLIGKCKDPLNSPQPGEVKGQVCRSLHACIFCEHCWIFAEDLPEVIRYRNRLMTEKTDMTDNDWEMLHGEAVREINQAILSGFPIETVRQAELKVRETEQTVAIRI